jgi:hypothetical protein
MIQVFIVIMMMMMMMMMMMELNKRMNVVIALFVLVVFGTPGVVPYPFCSCLAGPSLESEPEYFTYSVYFKASV